MMLVFLLLQGLAFGVLSALVARNKNRDSFGWFLIGFIFGIFGFVASLVVEKQQPQQKSQSPGDRTQPGREFDPEEHQKKCPDCAERIKLEARVCRYCGYRFDSEAVERQIRKAREQFESRKSESSGRKTEDRKIVNASDIKPVNDGEHCVVCGEKCANWGNSRVRVCKSCVSKPGVRERVNQLG